MFKDFREMPKSRQVYGPQTYWKIQTVKYSLEEQAQVDCGDKIIVTWFKDDKRMNLAGLNGKCRLLDAGTLEVKSTESSDAGVYKCVASNAYGAKISL